MHDFKEQAGTASGITKDHQSEVLGKGVNATSDLLYTNERVFV